MGLSPPHIFVWVIHSSVWLPNKNLLQERERERERERDRIEEREGVPERHKYLEKHTLKTHRQREKTHLHHWTQHTNKNPESINSFIPKFHFLLFIYSLIFLLFFTSLKKNNNEKTERERETERDLVLLQCPLCKGQGNLNHQEFRKLFSFFFSLKIP